MLTQNQQNFKRSFLNLYKQRFYFWRQLPMALLAGVRLVELDEEKAVATVPFKPRNKNPFKSMYFAVQSMAAELSTAAPAMLAIKGCEFEVALIIVNMKAVYSKKAKTKLIFRCTDYVSYVDAISSLHAAGDTVEVTAKTVGVDEEGDKVSTFHFTWIFKRKN
jgi:acyl-coenzyme A thioesterase PaaI-like protein